jgi:uncharacterized heparinase superfamily protein
VRALSLSARLQKLRGMSAPEVAQRVAYRGRTLFERAQYRRGYYDRPDRLRAALAANHAGPDWREDILDSHRKHSARFFSGVYAPAQMRRLFQTAYTTELEEMRSEVERVRRHEIEFFGRTFHFGSRIDWHADPVSGRQWPRVYHDDVPVHGGDIGFGDVKYVWEVNRHQFLVDLGKSFFLDECRHDAAHIRVLVREWMAENPYGMGVSWACPLEPAFRVLSWLWAYHLCLDDEGLDASAHALWLTGFYDHGRFLHRHLESYSSPFNHLIGEATALYALGVLFPEFHDAMRWRARGREVLEGRVGQQFYPDGGSVEQSTFYHHATLGFYILAVLLGRANNDEFSSPVLSAIERAIEFSMFLVQPDGRMPQIGGADDGKPIRMQHLPFWDFRPYQAIGAVMFDRPDFKFVAGRFHEDAVWLLGPAGLDRFTAMPATAPRETTKALTRSGYFVFRSDWSDRSDYVCFDCGEQAAGLRTDSVPSAAHGHADCLSAIVWLGGRPVLVDPGFYCYNGEPDWEVHFRKTTAHSTVRIDGRDQARHIAKMAWCHTYRPSIEQWHTGNGGSFVTGSHDGFSKDQPGGLIHRRTIWLRPGGYVLIADEITGAGPHQLEFNYQMAPGAAMLTPNGGLVFDGSIEFAWMSSGAVCAKLTSGGARPDEGWVASSLGVRQAAPRLSLTSTFAPPRTILLSVLLDLSATGRFSRVLGTDAGAINGLGLIVEGHDYRDTILASTARADPCRFGGLETDAIIAVCREQMGGSPEMHRVGGSYLRIANATGAEIGRSGVFSATG